MLWATPKNCWPKHKPGAMSSRCTVFDTSIHDAFVLLVVARLNTISFILLSSGDAGLHAVARCDSVSGAVVVICLTQWNLLSTSGAERLAPMTPRVEYLTTTRLRSKAHCC